MYTKTINCSTLCVVLVCLLKTITFASSWSTEDTSHYSYIHKCQVVLLLLSAVLTSHAMSIKEKMLVLRDSKVRGYLGFHRLVQIIN